MPCLYPIPAWQRQDTREIVIGKQPPDSGSLLLPCGGCLGCRRSRAQQWALRCHLELQDHHAAAFGTLTYDEQHKPPTLQPRHLTLWLKRLRKSLPDRTIRYFASGEYGEHTGRPHYHAILFGLHHHEAHRVRNAWVHGFTQLGPCTPQGISYIAGYTAKKYNTPQSRMVVEQVDPETGEVYTYQPPFVRMSTQPAIGWNAKRLYPHSWRDHAIHAGQPIPVPRYLHDSWKQQATPQQQEELDYEKYQKTKTVDTQNHNLTVKRIIMQKQQELNQQHRTL